MNKESYEVNFDGIVGPTHNYGGLSYGNVASLENQSSESNPRQAALQGLEKMKLLDSLGVKQAVLPPHERPHIPTLKALGFTGSEAEILKEAFQRAPLILSSCSSAASMWAANAATISPSIDTVDQRVHITPANLSTKFHRSIESDFTGKILKIIFPGQLYFKHHPALPSGEAFSDEGAANDTRFCGSYGNPGVRLLVYGRNGLKPNLVGPRIFPARQSLEASQTLARTHQLYAERVTYACQNPLAIDVGVFHNDVISVGNQHLFFYHEEAFTATEATVKDLKEKMEKFCDKEMVLIKVTKSDISLKEAVGTYLFNSQIITLQDKSMGILAPSECQNSLAASAVLSNILSDNENPLEKLYYLPLRESMRNGGGPACLRLRAVLNENELMACHAPVFFNDRLYKKLLDWIQKYYRDRLTPKDLHDPQLLTEVKNALDELTKILNLGAVYSFQK